MHEHGFLKASLVSFLEHTYNKRHQKCALLALDSQQVARVKQLGHSYAPISKVYVGQLNYLAHQSQLPLPAAASALKLIENLTITE